MTKTLYRVGTRGSQLALAQTQEVLTRLQNINPVWQFEIIPIQTKGDLKPHVALTKLGSNGLFVREVEQALLTGQIDFAVHSAKDLPAQLASGLEIIATPPRAMPNDVVVVKDSQITKVADLPKGAVIGTGSPRRISLMTHMRPDLQFKNIRGNVPTRLEKLQTQGFDALILAAAGLQRLKLTNEMASHYFPLALADFVPAPGQGILALECLQNNDVAKALLAHVNDRLTFQSMLCERAFLQALDGDCTIPLGCYSQVGTEGLKATAFLGDQKDRFQYALASDIQKDPIALGQNLAQRLKTTLHK